MALDQQLLEILACPDTHHAPLDHDAQAQTLTCTECGRIFPIRDDIPILLLDEAISPPEAPAAAAGSAPAAPAGSPATPEADSPATPEADSPAVPEAASPAAATEAAAETPAKAADSGEEAK